MEVEMKYIFEIYKQGSFSKAADNLFVTQPTLSIAVKRVETELGMPIFERKKNPVSLTPAGEIYVDKIRKIIQIEQDLHNEINDIKKINVGKLKIGGTNYINSYILPPIISKFMTLYPNIELSIIESSSDHLIEMVLENDIDISFNTGVENENKLIFFPAFEDNISLIIPNKFLIPGIIKDKKWNLSEVNIISIDEITIFKEIPFILLLPKNNLYLRSMKILNEAGFSPEIVQSVEQLATAYRFCLDGIGATFVGSKLLDKEGRIDERITVFSLDSISSIRCFQAVTNKNRYLSNAMKEFIRLTQEFYIADV